VKAVGSFAPELYRMRPNPKGAPVLGAGGSGLLDFGKVGHPLSERVELLDRLTLAGDDRLQLMSEAPLFEQLDRQRALSPDGLAGNMSLATERGPVEEQGNVGVCLDLLCLAGPQSGAEDECVLLEALHRHGPGRGPPIGSDGDEGRRRGLVEAASPRLFDPFVQLRQGRRFRHRPKAIGRPARLKLRALARDDFYASAFGAAYSAYMERPRLSRLIGRLVWGGDSKRYYESMAAAAEVPAGGVVIDCPCGAGPALRALRPGGGVRYAAVDLSPSMLRRARERASVRGLTEVEFLEASAAALPFPEGSADLFLSFWGLHCFDDPKGAIEEISRVLKPGGRLLGASFVRGGSLRQRLLVRPGAGDFGPLATEAEIIGWLEETGLAISDSSRSGPMLFFDATSGA
jgi:SAM-dependent methyltransferase